MPTKRATKKATTKTTKKPAKKTTTKRKTTRKPAARLPKGMVVMPSPVDPSQQVLIASELADDDMIEQELTGAVLPYFVYSFKQEGKEVTGLTVKGVSETVRRLNRKRNSGYQIRLKPEYMKVERDVEYNGEKGVEVSVFAENIVDGNSAWGIKFEAYKKTKRGGGTYNNTFAVEKALSKAERNAKRKLIPEDAAAKMITELIRLNSGKHVQPLQAPPQIQQTIVQPRKPKTSTPQDLEANILAYIDNTNEVALLIDCDTKLAVSPLYSDAFKKKARQAINMKVDSLNK